MPKGMSAIHSQFVKTMSRLVGKDFRDRRCLVAVSGGLDSTVLFYLACQEIDPKHLVVAHYHHGTRKTADLDRELVRRMAKKLGASFVTAERPAQKEHASELSLRLDRRDFLKEAKKTQHCEFILTAHHANDQLETLFMRLMRGTGPKGLSGIAEKKGPWVRPLLSLSRGELESFARENSIAWNEDESNSSRDYLRNRIRHDVIPVFIQASRDFGTEETILRRLHETTKELRSLVARDAKSRDQKLAPLLIETPYWWRLSEEDWKRLDFAERDGLLQLLFQRIGIGPVPRSTIKRARLALKSRARRFDLVQGAYGIFSCGHWFFVAANTQKQIPKLEDWFTFKGTKHFSARFPTPGDRLGSKKLKKLFLEEKIPAPERALLPVFLDQKGKVVGFFPLTRVPEVRCRFPFSFITESMPQLP